MLSSILSESRATELLVAVLASGMSTPALIELLPQSGSNLRSRSAAFLAAVVAVLAAAFAVLAADLSLRVVAAFRPAARRFRVAAPFRAALLRFFDVRPDFVAI